MSKHQKTKQSHKASSSRSYISSSDEEDETSSGETSSSEASSEGEDETTMLQPHSLKRKRQYCPQVSMTEQDYDDDASTIHCDQVLHFSKRRKKHKSKSKRSTRNSNARGNRLRCRHSSKPLTSSSGNNSDSNGRYSDTTTETTTASESESEDNHSKARHRNFRVKLIADGSMYGISVKASSVRMLINKLRVKFQRRCPGHVIDCFLLETDGDSIELTKDTIELDFLQRNITIKVMSHISRSHKRVTKSSRKQVD